LGLFHSDLQTHTQARWFGADESQGHGSVTWLRTAF
jgi:hypothetical protein